MIGCLRTRARKQPIIALYFEFETVLKIYNLEARCGPTLFANVISKEQNLPLARKDLTVFISPLSWFSFLHLIENHNYTKK